MVIWRPDKIKNYYLLRLGSLFLKSVTAIRIRSAAGAAGRYNIRALPGTFPVAAWDVSWIKAAGAAYIKHSVCLFHVVYMQAGTAMVKQPCRYQEKWRDIRYA